MATLRRRPVRRRHISELPLTLPKGTNVPLVTLKRPNKDFREEFDALKAQIKRNSIIDSILWGIALGATILL